MTADLFENNIAKSFRDEGLLTVYQNSKTWSDAAFKILLDLRSGNDLSTFTGEDLRFQIAK